MTRSGWTRASLEALVFALRRVTGPVSVLVAARADAPADPLTAGAPPRGWRDLLAAVPAAGEITLGPLDVGQIQRLLPAAITAARARRVAVQPRGTYFLWIPAAQGPGSPPSGPCDRMGS
jgi:hypothetical protein